MPAAGTIEDGIPMTGMIPPLPTVTTALLRTPEKRKMASGSDIFRLRNAISKTEKIESQ